jgi:hypothetical protein
MTELGVVAPDTPLPAPQPLVDAVPRPLTAAEFVEPRLVPLHVAVADDVEAAEAVEPAARRTRGP